MVRDRSLDFLVRCRGFNMRLVIFEVFFVCWMENVLVEFVVDRGMDRIE